MKKFVAVFDGFKMSLSTLNYAIQLSKAANAHLVGVFLNEFYYHTYDAYEVVKKYKDYNKIIKKLNEEDEKKRDKAVFEFQKACQKEGIEHSIHKDRNIAIQELLSESMYADLVIISQHETFTQHREEPPTKFIKEFLGSTQCPVLVVPKLYLPIDKIILLYDGGPSSLHAIKMFSYTLGNPENLSVNVFTVKGKKTQGLHLPGHRLMKEFIKRHFPKANYTVTKGDPEAAIPSYLENHQQNEMIVLGAYQRGEVSRWFKISMADILMRNLELPLFIAHNK